MLITVNDAFICVSFYFRLKVIRGDQPSVKVINLCYLIENTNSQVILLTIFFVMVVHTPLFIGYFATQRKWHNIGEQTEDIELIEELRALTHYGKSICEIRVSLKCSGILKFFDPITLTVLGWTVLSSQVFFGSAMFMRWKTINGLELSKV